MDDEMAYSDINNGIKQEPTTHFHHELLQAQLSAEDSRNVDNNDSAEESGESPLDFSVKKSKNYDEISGSDSISSPASSLNDTGGHMEDRRSDVSDSSHNNSHSNGSLLLESPPDKSSLFQQKQIKNQQLQSRLSPVNDRIGQPRTADSDHSVTSLPNMLNDLQMNLVNANALANSFPAMAALMDPRRLGGSKDTRPFKAYPKDLLSLSLGNSGIGLPHYLSSFANFENSVIMQGLNLSSEEIFSIYKQQLLGLRERDKYMETLKMSQHQSSVRTSTATTASPTTPSPLSISSPHHVTKHSNNHHHHGSITGNIPNGPSGSQTRTPSPHNGSSPIPAVPSSLTQSGRRRPRSLPDEMKDEAYWERRRKNNDAAKRSRDARRAKEDQIAIRAALLEQENLKLRVEVAALKTETAKLRCMLYNS